MIRYYALCSRNMYAVRRHERTIPISELVIVINTLDKEFEQEAVAYCKDQGIECHVTESDGTAPTGKNCLYDVFRQSDDDYMVMIDGDDFITQHGYLSYKSIATSGQAPDVLALECQYAVKASPLHWLNEGWDKMIESNMTLSIRDPDEVDPLGIRPFMSGDLDFTTDNKMMARWHRLTGLYISPVESHLRVTMVSKKAVDGYTWPAFVVGEDTLLYLQYKDAATKGELTIAHLWDEIPTYVYDMRVDGVCAERNRDEREKETPADWLNKMLLEMEAMEKKGQLHQARPRYVIIHWPSNYRPDALDLPDLNLGKEWAHKPTTKELT